jgi:hypothetical protein
MIVPRNSLVLPLLAGAALLLGLAVPATSPADNQPKAAAANKKAASVIGSQVKLTEAETLTNALVLLEGANHDYNGHRAKAIHAVKAAINILDASVLKRGTPQQKSAAVQDKAVVKGADATAKRTPVLHEGQGASDAQLRQAAQILAQVRPTLAANKQSKVLPHVDTAIKEIGIALKVR